MEPLEVDVDALRRGADQLAQARENVRAAFEAFQAAAGGYADAFGGDEIGMLLSVGHQACVEALAECVGTNLAELDSYVTGLKGMADGYREVEEGVAAAFRSILGKLG
ncbi:PE domain-containing protein [Micromonospora sp. KC723]|uniref:PE domain-containing protein n=1 Tax=Micromonospora sp. KC723 TaxID=2530381 RepID=UPI00104292FE|nr:PE domain-containing protein [Micromonospora sp. KC723]TDB75928.1 PE domain-containing protein [Micromonospora sp. KC723]